MFSFKGRRRGGQYTVVHHTLQLQVVGGERAVYSFKGSSRGGQCTPSHLTGSSTGGQCTPSHPTGESRDRHYNTPYRLEQRWTLGSIRHHTLQVRQRVHIVLHHDFRIGARVCYLFKQGWRRKKLTFIFLLAIIKVF